MAPFPDPMSCNRKTPKVQLSTCVWVVVPGGMPHVLLWRVQQQHVAHGTLPQPYTLRAKATEPQQPKAAFLAWRESTTLRHTHAKPSAALTSG